MVKWVRISAIWYKLTGPIPTPIMVPGSTSTPPPDRISGEAIPALEKMEPGWIL